MYSVYITTPCFGILRLNLSSKTPESVPDKSDPVEPQKGILVILPCGRVGDICVSFDLQLYITKGNGLVVVC